jgi:uncharacterized protein YbjQ (UPF0145 family)
MTDPLTRAASDLDHRPSGLLLSTADVVPGHGVVETLGLVRGNTIRARNVGVDIVAALKTLFGGEIPEYTKMMAESREQALDRMRAEAVERGANAVVAVRFTTSAVLQGASEILVYGTAVRLEPDEG